MRRSRGWKIFYYIFGVVLLGYFFLLNQFQFFTNSRVTMRKWISTADIFAPIKEIEHLNRLHEACMHFNDSIIPWRYGLDENFTQVLNKTSPNLVEYLKECPDIEILQAAHLRGHGYCQDSIAYVKFLQTRILPDWVFKMSFEIEDTTTTMNTFSHAISYFDLCPNTPLIIFNHFDEKIPQLPDWPPKKPIYLMPNIEMYELKAEHYWNVDVVLCKTLVCEQRVNAWYKQEGNPRQTKVFYTKHTSPDPSIHASLTLEEKSLKPKDFVDLTFLHTAGTSNQKGTDKVLDCWLERPDFPPLHLYMAPKMYDSDYADRFRLIYQNQDQDDQEEKKENSDSNSNRNSNSDRNRPTTTTTNTPPRKGNNIFIHPVMLNNTAFGQLLAEASVVLCPSYIEGYGHYINQARAAGALVLTTNIPPMNELIHDLASGLLIDATHGRDDSQLLGGTYNGKHGLKNVEGLRANFNGKDVCNTVDIVLEMTPEERQKLGMQAKKQYLEDLNYFAKQMQLLREFARNKHK